jgi:plasmid stabilization system protein ParE
MARATPRVVKLRPAVRDIIEIADYLADQTSLAVALRFVAAVERTCVQLARMPGIGARWEEIE